MGEPDVVRRELEGAMAALHLWIAAVLRMAEIDGRHIIIYLI